MRDCDGNSDVQLDDEESYFKLTDVIEKESSNELWDVIEKGMIGHLKDRIK